MTKALVLFSGGLDSLLTIKLLQKQGIQVTALTFTTPFFGKAKAEKQAEKYEIDLITKDISESHFEVVKNPKYGYGKAANPCIDCHGFMFRIAGEIADQKGYNLIASGEVLGQRPMSQNKRSLEKVRKLAGREILRPLSAKLLEPTSYEEKGLVDREQLLNIQGKGRHRQIDLAEKWELYDYSPPAGGCLLTERGYGDKLKLIIQNSTFDATHKDPELIKHGAVKIFDGGFAVIGRDQKGSEALERLFETLGTGYYLIVLKDFTGPSIVIKTKEINTSLEDKIKGFLKEKMRKLENIDFLLDIK